MSDVERDARGLWLPGCKSPNPAGRPSRKRELEYLQATIDAVPIDRWVQIVERAATDAIDKGDWHARRWLGDYIIGPAMQSVELKADLAGVDLLAVLMQKLPADRRAALDDGDNGDGGWSVVEDDDDSP